MGGTGSTDPMEINDIDRLRDPETSPDAGPFSA